MPMSTLVNYSGDDDFYPGGSFYINPMDSGLLVSIGSCMDVYCPPRKRSRITAPYIFRENNLELEKRPSIDVLPDECLFEILRRLPGGQERSSCARVSKRWLMLLSSIRRTEICPRKSSQSLNDDGYLTRCLEGKKATDISLAAIAVGTSSRGGLGKLSIRESSSSRGVTNLGLSKIAHGCPSLRVLSLWNVSANCPNLTALTIESCANIGNESLQAIGSLCPKLQSISIKDCPLVGDQGVAGLLSSATSILSRVKLQSLNITDFSLAVVGHYGKAITSLTLSGLQNVSEKGFWVMGNAMGLQTLISLTITSCRGITDVSLEAMGKGCPNLKQMCLRKCCFVSDNGLIAFAKAAGSLEGLQLEECNRVTQLGVIGSLSNCGSKLKSLSLVKCMGIKDIAVGTPMLSPCHSLRSLSIRNCPGFGSASLAMVGKLCPQLHHVDLSGLDGMTDAGLLPLLESYNCLLLNDLDLSKCAITDSGIAALSCGEKLNLQILSVSGCSKVSNKSMPSLCKLGKTLLGLNLQHCNKISSSSVELLMESLWRCDILF
ncbi:unnamed protein product, partial [Vitis vinifera]